jgi:NAD(P)-dependent dehydrogenase (short-subunit alcohol dehydrogenase family)
MTNTQMTALITGASRGRGRALAPALAARRWNRIITAREAKRQREVRDELAERTHVAALAGDVTDLGIAASLRFSPDTPVSTR